MFKPVFGRAAACVLLAVALGLSGCATMVEAVGSSQDTRILNPDSVQGERQSWLQGSGGANGSQKRRGNPNELAAARLRGEVDCKTPGPTAYTFFCRQAWSELKTDNPDRARLYLAAGLTLSNEVCDSWFNKLQVTQITLRQGSDAISTVGSVTSAILGFTQTPSETIGLTASLFGSAKQATDSLAANYIVAVDLTSVASAVREYRALYARDIEQAQASWNYYTSRRVIMAYDNTCSALFVRKFINARVSGSKPDTETQPLLEAAINAFVGEWRKYFKKEVTAGQLIDIYAYLFLSDTPAPIREKLKAGLVEGQLMNAEGVIFADKTTAQDLSNGLIRSNIDTALKTRALARVEAVRGQLAADASKKADAEKASKTIAEKAKADAAAATSLADSALVTANKLQAEARTKADEVTAQQTALGAAVDAPAKAAVQTKLDAAEAGRVKAQATADAASQKAAELNALAAAARSRAADAGTTAAAALTSAIKAETAATGAVGAPTPSPEAQAAAAPTPTGPNNRPLDAPPPP